MLPRVVLLYLALSVFNVWGQEECTDLRGRHIAHGLHYVPGPDTCTLCVCDNGFPKVCKAVLCSPPQDCRSFRVGSTCCDFICLDDVVKPASGSETNFRVAVTGAGLVVVLTIALIVYRVKKQKMRRPLVTDEQRSLNSIGYISGMGGTCETSLSGWKPPGHYLPRGEAPPPYDEAMAQSREHNGMMLGQYHRSHTALDSDQCGAHYANLPRPQQQMANPQGCFDTPLLQPPLPDNQVIPHCPTQIPVRGYPVTLRLTGSLSAIAGRALAHSQPYPSNPPSYYARSPALHRTIPRISTAEASLDAPLGFSRERSLAAEVRRSFHRPPNVVSISDIDCDTARSMPRHLDIASGFTEPSTRQNSNQQSRATTDLTPQRTVPGLAAKPYGSNPLAVRTMSDPNGVIRKINEYNEARILTDLHMDTPVNDQQLTRTLSERGPKSTDQSGSAPGDSSMATSTILSLPVDKPSCVCSYSEASAAGVEDADDYRHECENCKATTGSRWVVETLEDWGAEDEGQTQTLQRRPPPPAPPLPAANVATLPQRGLRCLRPVIEPFNRDSAWFNAIMDIGSDSEMDGE